MTTSANHKRICFIAHNATRTGAPIVLYQFVKWIREHQQHSVEVWFIEGGEMISEFEDICNVVRLYQGFNNSWYKLLNRGLNKIAGQDFLLKRKLKKINNFELVVFNTAASFRIIPLINKRKDVRFTAWLHEQSYSINRWYGNFFTNASLNMMDGFIVVSSYIKKYLTESFGIKDEMITVLPPFIDTKLLMAADAKYSKPKTGIQSNFVIGGCGMQLWLKGPDIFLAIASSLKKKYPSIPVKFMWIGAEGEMTEGIKHDIEKLAVKNIVEFCGAKKNITDYFKDFDLFLLPSREDSFPLVVLEACSLGKPVICFEGIGDITDLVGIIPGNVVPYASVEAMCERIVYYYHHPERAEEDGNLLRKQVPAYDTITAAPEMFKSLLK